MILYEYEAKMILKEHGIPTPKSAVAKTTEDASKITNEIGKSILVKAQVLAGRRGRAGLIRYANNAKEARDVTKELLGRKFRGEKVDTVMIEEKLDIARELYLGVTVDSSVNKPLIIASPEGGIEIEEIAAKFPQKIIKEHIDPFIGYQRFQITKIVKGLEVRGELASVIAKVIQSLYKVFEEYNLVLGEINPLVITKEGKVFAADAKMVIDDHAFDTYPKYKERLRREKPFGSYVELDGDIAIITNGASCGMLSMDVVSDYGGRVACFYDARAFVPPEAFEFASKVIPSNPRVRVIFFNIIGGGISRFPEVAKRIVKFKEREGVKQPIIVRLAGEGAEEGKKILRNAEIEVFDDLYEAIERVIKINSPKSRRQT